LKKGSRGWWSGMNEKTSIIIPVKNGEEKIEKCLDAVFNQTRKTFEVIVVDGHSTEKMVGVGGEMIL